MKVGGQKQLYSNKSGAIQKKPSHLVIKTNLRNSFDNRWAEVKIEGKNISSRSSHVCTVFGNSLFVHGGYDVEKGILGDFHQMDLSEDCQEFIWKKHNNYCQQKQIKLKSHTGVTFKETIILFGGQVATGIGNNKVYIHDLVTKTWKCIEPNIYVPQVDSHCAVVIGQKMYVYGGYMSDKADYLQDIYTFDLNSHKWEIVYKSGSGPEPKARSYFSMVEIKDNILIFGGTDGVDTLNDMWIYNIQTHEWKSIETKDTPEPRRGHSMVKFENYIFMFGGIQAITKEKNDIYIFSLDKNQWSKIHTTTNSIYDCSPTLRRSSKKKNSDSFSPQRRSPSKSERGPIAMTKILNENKQRKFMERKKELLKQFSEDDHEEKPKKKKRQLSPTTESMLKTLEAIGNQESAQKQLSQQIVYDDTHRFIIGKKPCARDGQSVSVFNGKMYIFGGDRHLMTFNDLYHFDLQKGVKSMEFYKTS